MCGDPEARAKARTVERTTIAVAGEKDAEREREDESGNRRNLEICDHRLRPGNVPEREDERGTQHRDSIALECDCKHGHARRTERDAQGRERVRAPGNGSNYNEVRKEPAGQGVRRKASRVSDAENIRYRLRLGEVGERG